MTSNRERKIRFLTSISTQPPNLWTKHYAARHPATFLPPGWTFCSTGWALFQAGFTPIDLWVDIGSSTDALVKQLQKVFGFSQIAAALLVLMNDLAVDQKQASSLIHSVVDTLDISNLLFDSENPNSITKENSPKDID